ncbi:MAG: hypothetical protein OIN84_16915 [Candidatus Methanoperedens sp.]|nr:hypothetical protein [Candidatus Methanoperedens sp. BLZ2]MBZ0175386.1 hypothetical protein [Candidatus Methanoperedens nitroreducens]MCX9079648.1 hypothetical protein [Candidatus Methanoperedens sp.]
MRQFDLDFLKTKIISIEETIEDIDNDLHHVKPEYIRKLERELDKLRRKK